MTRGAPDTQSDTDTGFRDAEAFLADLGVERRPIVVRLPDDDGDGEQVDDDAPAASLEAAAAPLGGPVSEPAREADDASPAVVDPADHAVDDLRSGTAAPLGEAVSAAVATVRRITAGAPASEGRVRRKLEERDLPAVVVDQALERARAERLVDDEAMAAALVAEWRAAGHGSVRIRQDLRKREFDADLIDRAVADAELEDPMAVAFALATDRAAKLRHVEPETAYRRVANYVARRGHPEAIARKAARDAVYDDRERDRVAGH